MHFFLSFWSVCQNAKCTWNDFLIPLGTASEKYAVDKPSKAFDFKSIFGVNLVHIYLKIVYIFRNCTWKIHGWQDFLPAYEIWQIWRFWTLKVATFLSCQMGFLKECENWWTWKSLRPESLKSLPAFSTAFVSSRGCLCTKITSRP